MLWEWAAIFVSSAVFVAVVIAIIVVMARSAESTQGGGGRSNEPRLSGSDGRRAA
jgi:hypothetical protein